MTGNTHENKSVNNGTCIIAEDVLISIAGTAASEVEGVATLARRSDIKGLFARTKGTRSIKVLNNEENTTIDVFVNLRYGARVPFVAGEIQKNVKGAVQSMSGRPVTKVNVHVMGIVFDESKTG